MSLILDNKEKLVARVDAIFQVTGQTISNASATRYSLNGVRHGSDRIKLEHVRIGGKYWTSLEAVRRFIDALSEEPVKQQKPASKAVDAVAAELKTPTKRALVKQEKERQAVKAGLDAHYAGVK